MKTIKCKECNHMTNSVYIRNGKCPLCFHKKGKCKQCAAIIYVGDGGVCRGCSLKAPSRGRIGKNVPPLQVCSTDFDIANYSSVNQAINWSDHARNSVNIQTASCLRKSSCTQTKHETPNSRINSPELLNKSLLDKNYILKFVNDYKICYEQIATTFCLVKRSFTLFRRHYWSLRRAQAHGRVDNSKLQFVMQCQLHDRWNFHPMQHQTKAPLLDKFIVTLKTRTSFMPRTWIRLCSNNKNRYYWLFFL